MLRDFDQKSYLSDIPRMPRNEINVAKGKKIFITFNGGSRGNPGVSGSGDFIGEVEQDGLNIKLKILNVVSIIIGERSTNNQAEYLGLIYALVSLYQLENEITIMGESKMILSVLKNVKITENFQKYQEFIYSILQRQKKVNFIHHYRVKIKQQTY